MKNYQRYVVVLILSMVMTFCLVSCEKKKQGKVVITEQEFVLRQDKENSFTIDARGKIKNVGDADVKRVVVTGYCRSCDEIWVPGKWFVSGTEKMPFQKDIISYLPVGNEETFSFKGVADMLLRAGQGTPVLPEKLEVVVESFETVE